MLCTNETDCILYPSYKLSCPSLINYHAKTTTNPCKTANPCQNDGICKHVTNSKKTKVLNCFCKDGFTGKHCERDVDECDLYQPCYNASQCQNTYGGFICNCSNNDCYNLTFQELYSKLSNKNYHQSTSISSSLSSILADGRTFHHNFEVHNNNSDTSERSFLSLLKSKDTLLGIFSGIFIVIFVFVLILIISLFVYKLKTIIKKPKIPESTSTSNRDIDEIEDDDEDDEPHTRQTTSKGFFKRKAKTYSSTSSRKKLAVNNNNVKLKLLNNDLNINSVHNTFQREIKLKNLIDKSTTTTKTLEKNLIKEASKKIIDDEKSPIVVNKANMITSTTSMDSLNNEKKCDLVVKLNNTTPIVSAANIISPDYNYIQLYNSNKKINIKNINKDESDTVPEAENLLKQKEVVLVINEQNNLDKEDENSTIIEDCQGK